ncbi:MAG: DUF3365 domain-containing protein [Desulfobulbales bacterium]|nr:DUF3365 domain-containing protein [Desulfobulbales bacterium]
MNILRGKTILQISLAAAIAWTVVLASLLIWNINAELTQTNIQASHQSRTFFEEFILTRFWNAMHGGVYVAITEETKPNPYLDDPLRDVTTLEGIRLTKINPAYMTRQIGRIAEQQGDFRVHITSLNPLRPENRADDWEKKALTAFSNGTREFFEVVESFSGDKSFKYMAPLYVEEACLKCHGKYGVKVGDINGGISITTPAEEMIASRNISIISLSGAYFLIWALGLFGMFLAHNRLRQEESDREEAIIQLEKALGEVKQLSGLLPICSSCKNIRDDQGYWQNLERYISEHSGTQFSYSICPGCAKKLYPEIYDKIQDKMEHKKP